MTWVGLAEDNSFPVLSVRDTLAYLVRSNNLQKLFGEIPVDSIQPVLLEFWRRYSLEWPDFDLYKAASQNHLPLSRCIPVYLHGDEGRGFKRGQVMILSFQGCIGRGSRPFRQRHPLGTIQRNKMGVNLQGSSFNSRLLFAAMPKKYYNTHPESRYLIGPIIWFMFFLSHRLKLSNLL